MVEANQDDMELIWGSSELRTDPLQYAKTLAAYNLCMNDRIYAACATLPDLIWLPGAQSATSRCEISTP